MLSTSLLTLPPRMPLQNPSRLPVSFSECGNLFSPGYWSLAAWTSIYQVKLPAKILFLHVEPSFFLSRQGFFNSRLRVRSTAVLALDFGFAERGEMLDDLPEFHASGLRDTQRGRVHLVLELLDDKVLAVHSAA